MCVCVCVQGTMDEGTYSTWAQLLRIINLVLLAAAVGNIYKESDLPPLRVPVPQSEKKMKVPRREQVLFFILTCLLQWENCLWTFLCAINTKRGKKTE